MKKKKILLGLAMAAAAVFSLSACGDDTPATDTPSGDKPQETTKYTVTFNTNGGSTVNPQSIEQGKKVTKPADPTKTATDTVTYTFAGWFKDAALTQAFNFDTDTINAATTLYAKWTETAKGGQQTEEKISLKYKDGDYTVKVDSEFVLGSELQPVAKNGFTFEGWYTEAELQNKVTDSSTLTDGQTLYAKYTVQEGYEAVDFQLLANDLEQGSLSADLPAGIFTIKKGAEIRNRIKTWTNPYNNEEKIESWTKSVKNGPIEFTAPGNGVLTMYLQNGSSSAATKKVQVTPSEGEAQLIEFSGANAIAPYAGGSPVVAINVDVTAGVTYTIERGDGGTIDWYQLDIQCVAEISAENGFAIASEGTVDFLEGEAFDASKIKLNATYENGKILPIDMTSTDVVIDSSAYDATTPGTYAISVKYKNYDAQTINVTVYDVQNIELGFNATYKGANNTAGNSPYINGKVKTVYALYDTLKTDYLSVIVNATSADGTKTFSKIVDSNITTNTIDFTTAGTKNVVVTFTTNGQEFNDEYNITVIDTEAYMDENENYVVTVDKNFTGVDGTVDGEHGNTFKTIAAALEFLGSDRVTTTSQKILYIGAGIYKEKLEITVPNLTIIGAGACTATVAGDTENYDAAELAAATVIEWDSLYGINDESGYSQVTDSTATVAVRDTAVYCTFKNITLSNYYNSQAAFNDRAEELVAAGLATKKVDAETGTVSYKFSEHRALALIVQSDKFKMENCSLLGFQDTVEFMTGRQYLKNCYISGTTDFIFGTNNTTYFDTCTIHTIKNADSDGGYITAFKGCNKGADDAVLYGAIFNYCTFEADSTVAEAKTAIGRPWGAYAAVMVMNSTIGKHVSKAASTGVSQGERYVAMNAKATDATVKFTEFNNEGDGSITATQAGVTLLDATAAADYANFEKVFFKNNGKVKYDDGQEYWDPTSTTVVIDNRIYYTFNNTKNATGTSYVLEDFELKKTDETKTKTVEGITFDATNGNITKRTTASNQDLVLQAGGAIKLTVEANTAVTVSGYYSVSIDINGTKTKSTVFTKFFDTATEVVITGVDGTSYLTQIAVKPNATAPEAATLTGITVSGAKDVFDVNDAFETTGLVVVASYSDDSYAIIPATDYQVDSTDVNMASSGTYDVVVTYGGKSDSYSILVGADLTITSTIGTSFKGTNYSTYYNVIPTAQTFDATSSPVVLNNMTYNNVKSNNTASNWAAFYNGGSITFDVNTSSTLRLAFYNASSLTNTTVTYTPLSSTDSVTLTTTDTVSAEGAVCSYAIPGAGHVTVSFSGSGYLGMIQVDTAISQDTAVVFHSNSLSGFTGTTVNWANNKVAGTQDRITVVGTNLTNSGYLEFKNDDAVSFLLNIDTTQYAAKVTISAYYDKTVNVSVGETALTLTKDETNSSNNNYIYTTMVESNGVVTIASTTDQNYLNYITITLIAKN